MINSLGFLLLCTVQFGAEEVNNWAIPTDTDKKKNTASTEAFSLKPKDQKKGSLLRKLVEIITALLKPNTREKTVALTCGSASKADEGAQTSPLMRLERHGPAPPLGQCQWNRGKIKWTRRQNNRYYPIWTTEKIMDWERKKKDPQDVWVSNKWIIFTLSESQKRRKWEGLKK